jgi:hexosaminidase
MNKNNDMKKRSFAHLWLAILLSVFSSAFTIAQEIQITPYPNQLVAKEGFFSLAASSRIVYDKACEKEAIFLQQQLQQEQHLTLELVKNKKKPLREGDILLTVESTENAKSAEAYTLLVDNKNIQVRGTGTAGVFYGIQSIRQVISNNQVPSLEINDAPRFGWRAFMLDEGRYFKGEKVVKDLMDEMAILKMNTFHWHLTDDQGWRIEIKKYPDLTRIGSKRKESEIGTWLSNKFDSTVHEGFYTQKQIKDIIQYAAERHITIIPEIEMPGHASAAIASYPWLGTENKQIEVPTRFGIQTNVYNVANPKVSQFLHDVLAEVMEMFPSKIVHIGGDEVLYDQWKASEEVATYLKNNQLKSPADLQISFTNGISNYLQQNGHRMMGWNEILGGHHQNNDSLDAQVQQKLSPDVIVHFWTGDPEIVTRAVEKGYDVVNSYAYGTYLDYDYELISLEKAYSFEPVPAKLPENLQKKILGLGCQMWGEWIPTVEKMNGQVFPRIAAYAEVGWTTNPNKNYGRFKQNLNGYLKNRWIAKGISFPQDQITTKQ